MKSKPRIYRRCCEHGCEWVVQWSPGVFSVLQFWTQAVRQVTGYLPLPMYVLAIGGTESYLYRGCR